MCLDLSNTSLCSQKANISSWAQIKFNQGQMIWADPFLYLYTLTAWQSSSKVFCKEFLEKHLRQKLKLELNCFFSFLWLFLNKLLLICIRRLSIQKAIAQCSLHVFLPVFCFFPSLSCPFPATMKVSDDLHDLTSQLQAPWSWVVSSLCV